MIKIYCDQCGMEIGQQDENGTLVYVEKTFQLLKNKQEPAIRKTEMIFCQICIRGLRQYIHNQREAQKK